jgi:hemerythrin-like domain-containing protein
VSSHRTIHGLIADLKSVFAAGNDQEFVKLSEEYQKLLTDHIFTEDRVLFESMAKVLDEISDHRVAKEFNDFEPGLRERSKAKFLTLLRNHGRKYDSPMCV